MNSGFDFFLLYYDLGDLCPDNTLRALNYLMIQRTEKWSWLELVVD